MHEADSFMLVLLLVHPSVLFKLISARIFWTLDIYIIFFLQFNCCLLKPNDKSERDGDENDGNKPIAGDHYAPELVTVAKILPINIVWLACFIDFRITFENVLLV